MRAFAIVTLPAVTSSLDSNFMSCADPSTTPTLDGAVTHPAILSPDTDILLYLWSLNASAGVRCFHFVGLRSLAL